MKFRRFALPGCMAVLVGLNACITLSPLVSQDKVSIEGAIYAQDGSPAPELEVVLDLPWLQTLKSRTDSEGKYRFDISGDQTITGIAAADLEIKAEDKQGAQLKQEFKALKTSLVLPEMFFWSQLLRPFDAAQLSQSSDFNFTWQHQKPEPRQFLFSLSHETGTIWEYETQAQLYSLPLAVLESQQNYRWQVSAEYSDYQAIAAPRSFSTGILAFKLREIFSITGPEGPMPELFDGSFSWPKRNDQVDFKAQEAVQLVIHLKNKKSVSALHWVGSGFTTRLEVRAVENGPLLSTAKLGNYQVLEWPELETEVLYLTLRPARGGFVRIRELRVLGKDR